MKRRSLFARLTAAAVAGRRALSNEAAESSSRLRRTAAPNLRHEDAELPPEARRRPVRTALNPRTTTGTQPR
jgi:hypothetical protein